MGFAGRGARPCVNRNLCPYGRSGCRRPFVQTWLPVQASVAAPFEWELAVTFWVLGCVVGGLLKGNRGNNRNVPKARRVYYRGMV